MLKQQNLTLDQLFEAEGAVFYCYGPLWPVEVLLNGYLYYIRKDEPIQRDAEDGWTVERLGDLHPSFAPKPPYSGWIPVSRERAEELLPEDWKQQRNPYRELEIGPWDGEVEG